MDPVTAGAVISAGSSIIGGLLGKKGQKDANAQNERLQREFAQNGIRWKVEDAKAAGLHPLFAIGGSGATYSPSAQSVMAGPAAAVSDMGQNIGRAVQAAVSDEEREQRALNLELLRSQIKKNEAEAQAVSSESIRAWANSASKPINYDGTGLLLKPDGLWSLSGDARMSRGTGAAAQSSMSARATVKPDDRTAFFPGDSSRSASTHPLWKEYFYGPDGSDRVLIPGDEPTEALESPLLWPQMVSKNLQQYGPEFLANLMRDFLGLQRQYRQAGSYKWPAKKKQLFGRGSPN